MFNVDFRISLTPLQCPGVPNLREFAYGFAHFAVDNFVAIERRYVQQKVTYIKKNNSARAKNSWLRHLYSGFPETAPWFTLLQPFPSKPRSYAALRRSTPPTTPPKSRPSYTFSFQQTVWSFNAGSFVDASEYREQVDNALRDELLSIFRIDIPLNLSMSRRASGDSI